MYVWRASDDKLLLPAGINRLDANMILFVIELFAFVSDNLARSVRAV